MAEKGLNRSVERAEAIADRERELADGERRNADKHRASALQEQTEIDTGA
jgi:hypothetical protein